MEHLEAQFPWLTNVSNGGGLESCRSAQQALTYQEHEEHVLAEEQLSGYLILAFYSEYSQSASEAARGCKRDVLPFMKKYFSTRVTRICNMSQLLKAFFTWTRTFTWERWFFLQYK